MGDGGGAKAGFVGKNAAGNAVAHGGSDGITKRAAARRPQAKRAGEDIPESRQDTAVIDRNDCQAAQNV